jgi:hypothetical protein
MPNLISDAAQLVEINSRFRLLSDDKASNTAYSFTVLRRCLQYI